MNRWATAKYSYFQDCMLNYPEKRPKWIHKKTFDYCESDKKSEVN